MTTAGWAWERAALIVMMLSVDQLLSSLGQSRDVARAWPEGRMGLEKERRWWGTRCRHEIRYCCGRAAGISARRPPPGEMAGGEFPFPLDACCPENEKLWSWVNSGVMVVGARIFALFRTHAGSRPARLALSRLDWVVDGPR